MKSIFRFGLRVENFFFWKIVVLFHHSFFEEAFPDLRFSEYDHWNREGLGVNRRCCHIIDNMRLGQALL